MQLVEDLEAVKMYGDRIPKRNESFVHDGAISLRLSRAFMRKIGKKARKSGGRQKGGECGPHRTRREFDGNATAALRMSKSHNYSLPSAGEPLEQPRRATQSPSNIPSRERPYSSYESHPEHRPRPLTARQIRRRRIRES